MSKDMLGVAVRKLVTLPANVLGVVCDLLEKLSDPEWIEATKRFLRKEEPWPESESVAINVSDTGALQPPYDGWELVEDAATPVGTLELELAEFLKPGENSIRGTEMRERAKKSGPMLGERHARALLEQQERIPEAWRKFYLVFPGTVWRARVGRLRVPCLFWFGDGWNLSFYWFGHDFYRSGRVVSLRK